MQIVAKQNNLRPFVLHFAAYILALTTTQG